jgi:uncharacterized coiled-coil DUF342 family protein
MAPAAAQTAKLMNNASLLTEIYAAHFSVLVEFESKKAELREAERTMIQMRQIIVSRSDAIREQQEQFGHAKREAEILQTQINGLRRDREEIVSSRDSYLNELRFTKDSLEKCQRDCQTLSKQVQHLTLRSTGQVSNEPIDESSELFSNIQDLQQKNLELISRFVSSTFKQSNSPLEFKQWKPKRRKLSAPRKVNNSKSFNATLIWLLRISNHVSSRTSICRRV